MRQTNSDNTNRDWKYSDGFLRHAKLIIGEQLLIAAPMDIDTKEASDIVFLVSGRGDVAFRVRRPAYLAKYPYDITFRSDREGFEKTELDKILDGHARWMLYGFGGADGQTLSRWVLLDLNAFRSALLRGQVKRPAATQNGDGTGFIAFDVRILKGADASILFAASYAIPEVVLPTAPRETTRDFWRKRIG